MALGSVVEAQLKAGDFGQAAVTAGSIATPSFLAKTLDSFAEALAGRDAALDRANATAMNSFRRLLASVLARTDDYLALLPVLAKAEPAAVIESAHALWRESDSAVADNPGSG
jgi:hypothetical protein